MTKKFFMKTFINTTLYLLKIARNRFVKESKFQLIFIVTSKYCNEYIENTVPNVLMTLKHAH